MYPPTKKNNDQYLTMLSFQFPLLSTLKNLEFIYLKSVFAYLIFSQHFIVSRFFLDDQGHETFHLKILELILSEEARFM